MKLIIPKVCQETGLVTVESEVCSLKSESVQMRPPGTIPPSGTPEDMHPLGLCHRGSQELSFSQ